MPHILVEEPSVASLCKLLLQFVSKAGPAKRFGSFEHDVNEAAATHDCMAAGGRAKQKARAEKDFQQPAIVVNF